MRKAVAYYDVGASPGEKEQALLASLREVLYELLAEHGWDDETLIERCGDEIETLADEIATEAV
jgi:hypothetical protein